MEMQPNQLNEIVKDALGEIANVAGGIATTALDKLFADEIKLNIMGQKLQLDLNITDFVNMNSLNSLLVPKEEVILISSPMKTRELDGEITITFSMKSALILASLFEHKQSLYEMLAEEDQIALKRIGQVLLDSYLSAFSTFLDIPTTHSESKMYVLRADKVLKFLQETVDKRVQNSMMFQTKFKVPRTEIYGEFELLCTLKNLAPVIQGIERKLGVGTDRNGIKQTDYLKLSDGKEIKNLDELISALRSMPDGVFTTYVNQSKNTFAEWAGRAYHNDDMANRLKYRTTRSDMLSALIKEKDKLDSASKQKEETERFEDVISNAKDDYNAVKGMLSEFRKLGKDVTYPEITIERVPAKIKLAEATKNLDDVQKVQNLISDIKKQLAAL